MNKRIAVIGIVIVGILALAATVVARELPNLRLAWGEGTTPSTEITKMSVVASRAMTASEALRLGGGLIGSATYPTAAGRLNYEIDRDGERELDVDVWGAEALTGQVVDVFVDGELAGSLSINHFGRGEFDRESDRGQSVPQVTADSVVELRTGNVAVAASQVITLDGRDDDVNDNDDDDVNDNDDDGFNDNDDDDIDDNDDDDVNDNDDDDFNDNDDDDFNDNDDDDFNDNDDDDFNDNDDDGLNGDDDDDGDDDHDDHDDDDDDDDDDWDDDDDDDDDDGDDD